MICDASDGGNTLILTSGFNACILAAAGGSLCTCLRCQSCCRRWLHCPRLFSATGYAPLVRHPPPSKRSQLIDHATPSFPDSQRLSIC